MVIKAGITAILAALLAGSVVYYGMPAEESTSGTVRLSHLAEAETAASSQDESGNPSQKRWIDKYLKADRKSADLEVEAESAMVDKAVSEDVELQIDVEEPDNLTGEAGTSSKQSFSITAMVDEAQKADQEKTNRKADDTPTEKPKETNTQTAKDTAKPKKLTFRKKKKTAQPDQIKDVSVVKPLKEKPKTRNEALSRLGTAMNQVENIETPELKDRAYMAIVDYAVMHKYYGRAKQALGKIRQTELRDTARSRVAIALAKAGKSDAAFEMVEAVEVEELRDVIRLQTIEAMIVPERLPPGMP